MDERYATLGKGERLRKRSQYLKLYSLGVKIPRRHFYVYFLENGLAHSRLGLTVSRRIGKPVTRNRIKRRLRDIFRHYKDVIDPPADLVINATKSSAEASLPSLEGEFLRAVKDWQSRRDSV